MKKKELKETKSIQEYITDNSFGFFITLCVVIFQALHTQYVLKLVSSLTDVFGYNLTGWHSLGVSSVIACGILYFTLKNNYKAAIGFSVFESYMNLCYYTIYIMGTPEEDSYLFWIAIPAAFAMPTLLGLFAHQLMKDKQAKVGIVDIKPDNRINQVLEQNKNLEEENKKQAEQISLLTQLNEKISQQLADLLAKISQPVTIKNFDTGVEVKATINYGE